MSEANHVVDTLAKTYQKQAFDEPLLWLSLSLSPIPFWPRPYQRHFKVQSATKVQYLGDLCTTSRLKSITTATEKSEEFSMRKYWTKKPEKEQNSCPNDCDPNLRSRMEEQWTVTTHSKTQKFPWAPMFSRHIYVHFVLLNILFFPGWMLIIVRKRRLLMFSVPAYLCNNQCLRPWSGQGVVRSSAMPRKHFSEVVLTWRGVR